MRVLGHLRPDDATMRCGHADQALARLLRRAMQRFPLLRRRAELLQQEAVVAGLWYHELVEDPLPLLDLPYNGCALRSA